MKHALLMLGALFGALARPAPAQDLRIDSAQFGYANVVQSDRYTVLRLKLSSGDQPWSGVLEVRTGHDGTQDAISSVRFSTTPGVSTPVEIPLLLPMYWSSLEFSARDQTGRMRIELRPFGSNSGVISAPSMPLFHGTAVLCVGDISAAAVLSRQDAITGGVTDQVVLPTKEEPGIESPNGGIDDSDNAHPVIQIADEGLPVHVEALDQFSAVLISESAILSQSRASRETLSRWVLNGGKMLVLMESAGAAPIALFPEFEPFLIDRVIGRGESPVAVSAALSDVARGITDAPPQLLATNARTMDVTDSGRDAGWTTPWKTDDERGLLVRGPVGFGIVGFLCVDPKALVSLAEPGGEIARRLMWEDALRVVATRDELGRAALSNRTSSARYLYSSNVGPSPSTEQALNECLEQLAIVEPLGIGIFAGMIGMMVLLALLIGPGDMLILKRFGQRHRSWMTACGWIGFASVIAAVLPMIFRDGKHGYSVFNAHDIIQFDEERSFVARTGLIGIFGGRPDRLPLPPHDSGAIWRGVGTSGIGSTLPRTFEPLILTSTETGQSGSRSASIGVGEDPATVRIGQWNFRTLMFNEPAKMTTAQVPRAKIRVDDFGVAIELKGLKKPSDAELTLDGKTIPITLHQEGDIFIGTLDKSASTNQPGTQVTSTTVASKVKQWTGVRAFELQWAEDRADAMHALEQDGEYAILTVSEHSDFVESITERIGAQGRTSRIEVYRIATRVERDTP